LRVGRNERFADNDISLQPFNAFLSGFSATVGQFVLTVSLRMQTNPENKADFESISHERYVESFTILESQHWETELTYIALTEHSPTSSSAA
jgi:hypothetical protein